MVAKMCSSRTKDGAQALYGRSSSRSKRAVGHSQDGSSQKTFLWTIHPARLQRAMLAQHAQHAPLLVRQAVAAQAGPRVGHDGFARLQQQARQVAVLEGGHGAAI